MSTGGWAISEIVAFAGGPARLPIRRTTAEVRNLLRRRAREPGRVGGPHCASKRSCRYATLREALTERQALRPRAKRGRSVVNLRTSSALMTARSGGARSEGAQPAFLCPSPAVHFRQKRIETRKRRVGSYRAERQDPSRCLVHRPSDRARQLGRRGLTQRDADPRILFDYVRPSPWRIKRAFA
jgi:hypothetical protein